MQPSGVFAMLAAFLPAGITVHKRWSDSLACNIVVLHRKAHGAFKGRSIAPAYESLLEATVIELCQGSDILPQLAWPEAQRAALRDFLAGPSADLRFRGEQRHARRPESPTIKLNRLLPPLTGISVIRNSRGRVAVKVAVTLPKGVFTHSGAKTITAKIGSWGDVVPAIEKLMVDASPLLPNPLCWPEHIKEQVIALCANGGSEEISLPLSQPGSKTAKSITLPLLRQTLPTEIRAALERKHDVKLTLCAVTATGNVSIQMRYAAQLASKLHDLAARVKSRTQTELPLPDTSEEAMAPLVAELIAHGMARSPEPPENLLPLDRMRLALPRDVRCTIGWWERGNRRERFVKLFTAPKGAPGRSKNVRNAADFGAAIAILSCQLESLTEQQRAFIADVSNGTIKLDLPWQQVQR